MNLRRAPTIRHSALARPIERPAAGASKPPVPGVLGSRLAFALYAIGMISGLGTITALIERAAP